MLTKLLAAFDIVGQDTNVGFPKQPTDAGLQNLGRFQISSDQQCIAEGHENGSKAPEVLLARHSSGS